MLNDWHIRDVYAVMTREPGLGRTQELFREAVTATGEKIEALGFYDDLEMRVYVETVSRFGQVCNR